jgi:hypothetical protein
MIYRNNGQLEKKPRVRKKAHKAPAPASAPAPTPTAEGTPK